MIKIFKVISLIIGLFFVQVDIWAQKESKLKVGDELPQFTLNSEVYGQVSPADLHHKVVMISLFATWCGPCQKELAEIEKTLYPAYGTHKDFRLLVIGREHTDAELTEYNARKKFTFPLYPDPKREIFSLFADQTIPRTYLFDKNGKLIYFSTGYSPEEFQKLMGEIDKALKQ